MSYKSTSTYYTNDHHHVHQHVHHHVHHVHQHNSQHQQLPKPLPPNGGSSYLNAIGVPNIPDPKPSNPYGFVRIINM